MILIAVKKTGNKMYTIEIEPNDNSYKSFLGDIYEEIYINDEFKNKNIIVMSNPKNFESGLEPNLFVINYSDTPHCKRILFGNTIFLKRENDSFVSLNNKDIEFISNYIDLANMSENEKFMASLLEYTPEEVGIRFNKEKRDTN